jgi:hypothetical protein
MRRQSTVMIAVSVLAPLLFGCGEAVESKFIPEPPAMAEKLAAGLTRITLTESASKRLGIRFEEMSSSERGLQAPFAVVLYDNHGGEWVYISPQPNVFVRASVKIVRVEGNMAQFLAGPPAGTKLVTDGAAQLLGIESGVGQ